MGAGATISGLEGNIAIPRQTGGAAAFGYGKWRAVGNVGNQIALTPKTVELHRTVAQVVTAKFNRYGTVCTERVNPRAGAGNGSRGLERPGTSNQPLGILTRRVLAPLQAARTARLHCGNTLWI